jgi:2'-5' RNA ligase
LRFAIVLEDSWKKWRMPTYRLFIAAHIPGYVKQRLVDMQAVLRQTSAPIAWVAPQAMHLTFHFLGDTEAHRVAALSAMLDAIAPSQAPNLALGHAGAFPHLRRPQVLWLGLRGDLDLVARIHATLSQALTQLGITPERRPFQPHLTIGRMRREVTGAQQAALERAISTLPAPAPDTWPLEQVSLFRSELLAGGPRYSELATVSLPKSDA